MLVDVFPLKDGGNEDFRWGIFNKGVKMSKKIGIYVCECGPNIAEKVDIDRILKTISSQEEYQDKELIVKCYKLLCSIEGREFLEKEIKENELTHLVIAACSPRDHDITFMNVCKKTHLNPYLYKLVNIREQCAWIIPDKEKATDKAIQYIHAAIRRVLYQTELEEKELECNPDVLVIGGGIAGIETSLSLASKKRKVYLVEKTDALGGKSVLFKKLLPRQGGSTELVHKKCDEIQKNGNIQVFKKTELERVVGFFGNFEISLQSVDDNNVKTELKAGAIVVATGFTLFDPGKLSKFTYKKDDDVYTSLEIEEKFSREGKILLRSGKVPKSVALIHCVGREEKGYCSKICCNYMFKIAHYLKSQDPDVNIKEFYRDLCVSHKEDQHFFEDTRAKGIDFIRIKDVEIKGTRVKAVDSNDAENEILFDMVILASAVESTEGTKELSELLAVPLDETGFFQEAHQQINPVETSIDGIYVVGAAHSPRGISESMLQAQAASGKILTHLIPGEKIVPEVTVSEIIEPFCTGCQTCLDVCCYGAIYFDEKKCISVVNEAVCRGCGNCVGSCPSNAIRAKNFTNPQLYQEVIEAIR